MTSSAMPDPLADIVREFARLRKLADDAIAQVSPEQLFTEPTPESNSVAIVMKHLAGNMRSRWTGFLTSDGEKPDRNRDSEFEIEPDDSPEHLFAAWSHGWSLLFDGLAALSPGDLAAPVVVRGERHSAMQAILRQLTHYAYHVGQVVYLARFFAGPGWKTLSIPRGGSRSFNRTPRPYLDPDDRP